MQNKIQILKADAGKSLTVECLQRSANCIIFMYTDEDVFLTNFDKFGIMVWRLNSKGHALNEAYKDIDELAHSRKSYDYFILYTNLKETDSQLQDAIDMLSKMDIPCRCIMITCKP